MTDHDERERLAEWLERFADDPWAVDIGDLEALRGAMAEIRVAARLLREPVNARLLEAAKDARQYMLDGCPAPVSMGEPLLKKLRLAIAAAESAPRETPSLIGVLLERNAECNRLTARVKELEGKLYGEETDHVALMEAELARLRAPRVGTVRRASLDLTRALADLRRGQGSGEGA